MEIAHYHFITLDSTNNCAKRNVHLFDPEKLTVITSGEQTAGRGRGKRHWKSPYGLNIYATFCFFFPGDRLDVGNLSQLLAISAAKTLESLFFTPEIKWPNDILLSGKKLGGVLCETVSHEGKYCVINGIGLNVNMEQELLDEIDIPATSLMAERKSPFSLDAVHKLLQENFKNDLKIFISNGFSIFLPKLTKLSESCLQTKIRFHDHQKIWEGIFHSLNSDGSLNLLLPNQEIKKFISGEILFENSYATV